MIARSLMAAVRDVPRQWRLVLLLTVTGLVLASLVALPFHAAVRKTFGSSLALMDLEEGFNYTILYDLFRHQYPPVAPLVQTALMVLMAATLVHVLLSGGILVALRDRTTSWKAIAHGCASYTGRFLGLFLLETSLVALVILTMSALFGGAAFAIGADDAGGSRLLLLFAGMTVIALFAVGLIVSLFDYSRIALVFDRQATALSALRAGLRFVLRHIPGTLGLFTVLLLLSVALFAAVLPAWRAVAGPTAGALALLAGIQQLFALARSALRIFVYSSELNMYRALENHPVPGLEPEAPSPYVTRGV